MYHVQYMDWVAAHTKPIAQGVLLFVLLVWSLLGPVGRLLGRITQRRNCPDPEKSTQRDLIQRNTPLRPQGVWIPVDFKRPTAKPYPDWDVHKTQPLPYRPFRYGPYHITMGLRAMKWDDWIELDNHFLKFHAIKAQRIAERGPRCNRTAPEAFDGAVELLEEL